MSAVAVCLLTILVHAAKAGPALRGQPLPRQMNRLDVETELLSELSNVFRGGSASEHISSLEVELDSMYQAMPKDAEGLLGHSVVPYMLHRFFVQKHSWFIRGLEPGNVTALQEVTAAVTHQNQTMSGMLQWVPSYLVQFIEEMHDGRGISLRELAVLAATLEDLIHKESNQRLEMAFTALELPFNTTLNEEQMRWALEVYMMIYMKGGNFTHKGQQQIMKAHMLFARKAQDWDAVQQWMHSVQVDVMPASVDMPLDFNGASRVVEEVGRRYGTYNEGECAGLRADLLKIESTKAGRVRLADYYKQGLSGSGAIEFNEKIRFLRALGVVDESNPAEPYVIVPNYVASYPNCLRSSGFYVVCCRNECEDLLSALEKKFKKPTANPEEIVELVATLSTKTVEPRTLPDVLVQRLKSIADANDGMVPLHGRLFAQWLHHAFPRECPYPQKSSVVAPMTVDEGTPVTGHETAEMTNEEMQAVVDGDSCMLPVGEKAREHHNLPENDLPWDDLEELLHPTSKMSRDVVKPEPAVQKASWGMAVIAWVIPACAVFVWKLTPENKKSTGWRDGCLV